MALKLFLCGDVMTGRGIDQILPSPCDPALDEPWVKDARDYVRLAEEKCGPIPRRVAPTYVWGDALEALERERPDARIANLETAITDDGEPAAKGINYRMSPSHVDCISAAHIDCCVLANNHVLDWGTEGLVDTLDCLQRAGIRTAGAGRTPEEAEAPALLETGGGRLLVYAFGMESAGVPPDWAATAGAPGVSFLPDLSRDTANGVADRILAARRAGDRVVVSIHWGSNWGYRVSHPQHSFARRLIDAGAADVIHGHSSHHPRPLEIYRDRLILHGCGDFLNDYEGIRGHEAFRPELTLMYFPVLEANGTLRALELTPMRIRRFRLERADGEDAEWLAATLRRESKMPVDVFAEGRLRVR